MFVTIDIFYKFEEAKIHFTKLLFSFYFWILCNCTVYVWQYNEVVIYRDGNIIYHIFLEIENCEISKYENFTRES